MAPPAPPRPMRRPPPSRPPLPSSRRRRSQRPQPPRPRRHLPQRLLLLSRPPRKRHRPRKQSPSAARPARRPQPPPRPLRLLLLRLRPRGGRVAGDGRRSRRGCRRADGRRTAGDRRGAGRGSRRRRARRGCGHRRVGQLNPIGPRPSRSRPVPSGANPAPRAIIGRSTSHVTAALQRRRELRNSLANRCADRRHRRSACTIIEVHLGTNRCRCQTVPEGGRRPCRRC